MSKNYTVAKTISTPAVETNELKEIVEQEIAIASHQLSLDDLISLGFASPSGEINKVGSDASN